MSLRLITGLANAGKTGEVLNEALVAVAAGSAPLLAVPKLTDARRLETELSGKTPLGIRVVTLYGLTLELWQLYGDGRRVVGRLSRDAILRRLLDDSATPEIAKAAQTPGFVRFLSRLAAGAPERDEGAAAGRPSSRAIRSLIERYRTALQDADLVEEGWLGDLIAAAPPRLAGPLGIARFDTLTTAEIGLLAGLSRDSQVSVALTWEAGCAATRANDYAVEVLSALAREHVVLTEQAADDEIQRLARGLYEQPAGLKSTGAVVSGLAAGGEAEAALIARFAAQEMAQGAVGERIAIAFPTAGRRIHDVQDALDAEGVAADFNVAQPLSATLFGQALLGLLALALGVGGRLQAMAFIASPFSGVDREMGHRADSEWRKDRTNDSTALLDAIGGLGESPGRLVRAAREAVGGPLTPRRLAEWQDLPDALFSTGWCGARASWPGRQMAQDAASHRAVIRALAGMAQEGGKPLGPGDVVGALSTLMVSEDGDEVAGRVQVCDFSAVGARRFDVLILGGLTESEASLGARDSLEHELRREGLRLGEVEQSDKVRLEFYSLVSRARHRLYLVRQEADSEGRTVRASTLWEDAHDVYRPLGSSAEEDAACPPRCERLSRADIEEFAPALTVSRRLQRRSASGLRMRTLDRGQISSDEGLSAIGCASVFSATEIEAYLECPYRWFYDRVVRPEEIDAAFDARELGTRAHRLLAAFYRRLADRPEHKRVTPEWLNEALALFDEVAETEERELMMAGGLAEELSAARAVVWARRVIGQDASLLPPFVPEHAELGFGDDGASFLFAGSPFHGCIDRVDVGPGSVFVTDYKSSRDVVGVAKFESDAKVQAVIYACAAHDVLAAPVSGSVYRSMRSGKLRGFWRSDLLGETPQGMCEDDAVDAEGFAALVARTEERVAGAIAGMRMGRIPRVPAVKRACSYCAISSFCEGAGR